MYKHLCGVAPESCNTVPEEYYERVKTMHEDGGHGSIGYNVAYLVNVFME